MRVEPRVGLSGQAASPTAPVSPETTLAGAQNSLNTYAAAPPAGITLPSAVTAALATMNQVISTALRGANGIISGITPAQQAPVAASIAAMQTSLAPLSASSDSATAATALDPQAYVALISLLLAGTSSGQTLSRQLINPNLFQLAAQYLGDVTRWDEIAAASNLIDPQPIGTFNVTIPAA